MMIQRIAVSVLALSLALGPLPASAQLFGPNEEQRVHEAQQDGVLAELGNRAQTAEGRIQQLEDRVRSLTSSLSQATGTNEELAHQIRQQNEKIDAMQKDFAYRLCTLSAQQLGASDAMNCAAAGTASAVPQSYAPPARASQADPLPPVDAASNFDAAPPVVRGRPPGTLGTLPAGPGPLNGPMPVPGNTGQYDAAMNLMSRAQYAEAAAAFRGYADANPGDTDLSPQAIYWVGNIGFLRQDYAGAARAFAETIKKYPKSTRAPDAMFKLAQSFMALGQKSEGCTTLGLIRTRYPNAAPQVVSQAATLRKTACSK
jgi:tol-pal system protein YbgF